MQGVVATAVAAAAAALEAADSADTAVVGTSDQSTLLANDPFQVKHKRSTPDDEMSFNVMESSKKKRIVSEEDEDEDDIPTAKARYISSEPTTLTAGTCTQGMHDESSWLANHQQVPTPIFRVRGQENPEVQSD